MIVLKRIYEPEAPGDGYRVLVDRLWPRGVKKEELHFDAWAKELAPSTEIRRRFGHDPARFQAFQKEYRAELRLAAAQATLESLAGQARKGTLTLLYAARDPEVNHAVVLKKELDRLLG